MLDDFPDGAVGYVVVFVDYSVSEADDCFVVSDLFGDGYVVVCESSCGFADDFELTFDGGAQQLIFFVIFEGDFGGGFEYQFRCVSNVPKMTPDFNFHRLALWSDRPRLGSKGFGLRSRRLGRLIVRKGIRVLR